MARAAGRCRVIAVSDAVYPCWFADVAYSCDRRWWQHHLGLPSFGGLRISLEETPYRDVLTMKNTGTEGFDPDPGSLRSAGNSGYQALHLAAHFGIASAILVGFDLHGQRWFGEHPTKIRMVNQKFETRVAEFEVLGRALKERGISVKNASYGSMLKCFERQSLETFLGISEAVA